MSSMKSNCAIQARIYPTDEQRVYINKLLGSSRFVYNKCLDFRKTSFDNGVSVSDADLIKHLVGLKQEFPWLREAHSKVLQQSVRDLNTAYSNFFRGKSNYPVFKKKSDNRQSCRFPKDAISGVRGNRIDLIRELKDIHFKCSRRDERWLNANRESINSVTLTKTPSGEYIISFGIYRTAGKLPTLDTAVGIDLGIKTFVVTSDGEYIENPRPFKKYHKKLRKYQRRLSKTHFVEKTFTDDLGNTKTVKRDSRNKRRYRKQVAKIHKKIADIRLNHIHQTTAMLVRENQTICIEDLNVKGMLKNKRLAKHVQDCAWGEFRTILASKCERYGRQLVVVGRFYPSSKLCHHCGYKKTDLTLKDRSWVCPVCGERHDRDFNAALNILSEGLRISGLSSPVVPVGAVTPTSSTADAVIDCSNGVERGKE